MMQVLALLATASALVAPPALPGSRARRAHTPVRMLELPTFPTFDLDSIFKSDPATMSREPGWLKKAREVSGYADRVAEIEALAGAMAAKSDEELRGFTDELRRRRSGGASLDDLLPEAFAACREASTRALKLRHYDVQLVGGMALHEGKLAEMATGEGKTLVATLPLYLRSLDGRGCHVITVNDYLARRDAETLQPLFDFLGLTVGVVQSESTSEQRQAAYAADVTYVTNNELGFDYLRDHLAYETPELTVTQRPLHFAIVDEADSILRRGADAAIISARATATPAKYEAATLAVNYLERGRDYEVDYKARRVTLTDGGYETVADLLGVADDPLGLYGAETKWAAYVFPALNAKELYFKERDYIVDKGELKIVDEFTGRVMEGRRWNGGLHQAVEAKEKVEVKPEQVTVASITYQSLFLLYPTLSGMTGTAKSEAKELGDTYGLDVLKVPTAKPLRREDGGDLVFKSKLDKFRYVLRDVKRRHASGQPVLCGTTSIEDATLVSQLLANEGVPHRVLNANPKLARKESEIVSQAGRRGAVTIATNMAGRGTDILLGGNAALTAKLKLREALAPAVDGRLGPLARRAAGELRAAIFGDAANGTEVAAGAALDRIDEFVAVASAPASSLTAAGSPGLAACARTTTPRGPLGEVVDASARSGRQGDAGASCYAISLEDKMFNVFGADKMQQLAFAFDIAGDDGEPLQSDLLSKSLATIQEKVETYYREMRTNLVRYDKIVDVQRRVFYNRRQQVLTADRPTVEALMGQYVADTAADTVANATLGLGADGDFASAYAAAGDVLRRMYPAAAAPIDAAAAGLTGARTPRPPRRPSWARAGLADQVAAVEKKGVGEDDLPAMLMRFYVMREFDAAWQQHLRDLEFLRENVGFQSYSQKDPFQEWTIQSNELFTKLSAKDDAAAPAPADTVRAKLNPADDKPNRAEPRGKKKGGKSRRR
ncbi:ATPase-coupled protein transmembrane transporter [Aureococcus anophagefferens]|nr:ATPase-coupled protein transmembrane transporter [Aureococcus anophagefferens]